MKTIISIFLAVVITGTGVYFFQKSKLDTVNQQVVTLQTQNETLTKEKTELKKNLDKATTQTETDLKKPASGKETTVEVIPTTDSKPKLPSLPKTTTISQNNDGSDCTQLPEKLLTCQPYRCRYKNPMFAFTSILESKGIIDEKCNFVQSMPNNGKMECNFPVAMLKDVSDHYKSELYPSPNDTYTAEDKRINKVMSEALNNPEVCKIDL